MTNNINLVTAYVICQHLLNAKRFKTVTFMEVLSQIAQALCGYLFIFYFALKIIYNLFSFLYVYSSVIGGGFSLIFNKYKTFSVLIYSFIIWLFKILYSDWLTSGP